METYGHNTIGVIERLLNAIAMMHVDIEVEYPAVVLEKLQYTDNDVIDVAETACFGLFRVVKTARPVYGDVRLPWNQNICSVDATPHGQLAEIIQPLEGGAIECLVNLIFELGTGVITVVDPFFLLLTINLNDILFLAENPLLQVAHVIGIME